MACEFLNSVLKHFGFLSIRDSSSKQEAELYDFEIISKKFHDSDKTKNPSFMIEWI